MLLFWELACQQFCWSVGLALCPLKWQCLVISVIEIPCYCPPSATTTTTPTPSSFNSPSPSLLLLRQRNPLPLLCFLWDFKRRSKIEHTRNKHKQNRTTHPVDQAVLKPILPLQIFEQDEASLAFLEPVGQRTCRAFVATLDEGAWWLQYCGLLGQQSLGSLAEVALHSCWISNMNLAEAALFRFITSALQEWCVWNEWSATVLSLFLSEQWVKKRIDSCKTHFSSLS